MNLPEVNIIPVIIAAVVSMIVGFFWYSSALFGKQWMKLVGLTEKDMETAKANGMGKTYAGSFAATLITAYALSVFLSFTGAVNYQEALKYAGLIWLGFIACTKITDVLFLKKPLKLFLIDSGYQLASLIVMSIILVYIV